MQWVLQEFEDTAKLARALDRAGVPYSFHKVVPFVGELQPEPEIADPSAVVLFGSYTLWRFAEKKGLFPGVFRLRPYVEEKAWQPYLLNGPGARFLTVRDIPAQLEDDRRAWFLRPVSDSKEIAGKVLSTGDIHDIVSKVLAMPEEDIPGGALRPETQMMLCPPARIQKEWRIWVVSERVVTWSLYVEGRRVVYRHEIDEDALAFAEQMIAANPNYATAYVMDVCRTDDGLRLLETNCLNAAGFYAADLSRLVHAIEGLGRGDQA
ncbi:MAG: ATP-grasp domain-containing protein [Paracoccaceae bacterium]